MASAARALRRSRPADLNKISLVGIFYVSFDPLTDRHVLKDGSNYVRVSLEDILAATTFGSFASAAAGATIEEADHGYSLQPADVVKLYRDYVKPARQASYCMSCQSLTTTATPVNNTELPLNPPRPSRRTLNPRQMNTPINRMPRDYEVREHQARLSCDYQNALQQAYEQLNQMYSIQNQFMGQLAFATDAFTTAFNPTSGSCTAVYSVASNLSMTFTTTVSPGVMNRVRPETHEVWQRWINLHQDAKRKEIRDSIWSVWVEAQVTRPSVLPTRTRDEATQKEAEKLDANLAIKRAEKLLLAHLSEQQKTDYNATKNFVVHSPSGKRYRVGSNGVKRIDDAGETIESWCVHTTDLYMPVADRYLTFKLYLEGAEDLIASIANRSIMDKGSYRSIVPATRSMDRTIPATEFPAAA